MDCTITLSDGDMFRSHGIRFVDGKICFGLETPDGKITFHATEDSLIKCATEFLRGASAVANSPAEPVPNYRNPNPGAAL